MKSVKLKPSYIRKNGMNLPFALCFIINSNIVDTKKRVIYIFHLCNIIDLNNFQPFNFKTEYLLNKIFEETAGIKIISKEALREYTGITDRKTFNKYFDPHLIKLGLKKNRTYTLRETHKILLPWVGDGNSWEQLEAYSKKELADKFFDGKESELQFIMTENKIIEPDKYKAHDYIRPADVFRLRKEELGELFKSEEEYCLEFYLYLFLLSKCV